MSWVAAMTVLGGAVLGGWARYLSARFWPVSVQMDRPVLPHWRPTLLVNLVGSLLLGVLVGSGWQGAWMQGLTAGFCGALTTYSTWAYELLSFAQVGKTARGLGYLALSVTAGLAAAGLGLALGGLVTALTV